MTTIELTYHEFGLVKKHLEAVSTSIDLGVIEGELVGTKISSEWDANQIELTFNLD